MIKVSSPRVAPLIQEDCEWLILAEGHLIRQSIGLVLSHILRQGRPQLDELVLVCLGCKLPSDGNHEHLQATGRSAGPCLLYFQIVHLGNRNCFSPYFEFPFRHIQIY